MSTPEEAMRMKGAYEKLFKTPNGKKVLADMRRRWLEDRIIGSTAEDTIAKAAYHDVVQTIVNLATPEER